MHINKVLCRYGQGPPRAVLMGIIGVVALSTPWCGGSKGAGRIQLGEADRLVMDGLQLSEAGIQVRREGGELVVRVRLTQDRPVARQGQVSVSLRNPVSGEVYPGAEPVDFAFDQGSTSVEVRVPGVPLSSEFGHYIVTARVETATASLVGHRSLALAMQQPHLRVMGQDRAYRSDGGILRIVATDRSSGAPLAGAAVQIIGTQEDVESVLWSGTTGPTGQAEATISTEALRLGEVGLRVSLQSPLGDAEVHTSLKVVDEHRILLTTDKPIYQPEQTIHVRALSLGYPGLRPHAGIETTFEIFDAQGTKVGKQDATTNDYGIAATTFKLGRLVNLGTWRIVARVGDSEQEKAVTVSRYALPKFKVALEAEQPYYRPGQTLRGTVRASYFFGQKVVGGQVTLRAYTFDAGFHAFAEQVGFTDDQGVFDFQVTLPSMIPGLPLEQGGSFVYLEATVRDAAVHEEKGALTVLVAQEDVVVQLIPEAHEVAAGVDNVLYVVTADPTGAPLSCDVTVSQDGQDLPLVQTDDAGLGELRLTPASSTLSLTARADCDGGLQASQSFQFTGGTGSEMEGLLVRAYEPVYALGETAQITVLAPRARDRIYLDVIAHNRAVVSRTLDVQDGQAHLALDLSPELTGVLQLRAYYLADDGNVIRNQRLIYVEDTRGLRLSITPAQEVYRPGESALVRFQVTDDQGQPVQAAIGVNVVDEAVYGLTEFRPGLEKTYFQLESELLQPRYFVKSCSLSDVTSGADDPEARRRAQVYLAASGGEVTFPIDVQSRDASAEATLWVAGALVADDLSSVLQMLEADRVKKPAGVNAYLCNGRLVDPWGQAYHWLAHGDEWAVSVTLKSAGPDERWGTADDLSRTQSYVLPQDSTSGGGGGCLGADTSPSGGHGTDDNGNNWVPADGGLGFVDASAPPPGDGGTTTSAEGPAVRDDFPETLYSNPALITDPMGTADLHLDLADSITTWRVTGIANSKAGLLGSTVGDVRVFQEFFVDLDLPAYLMNATTVSLPVAVYNYTDEVRTVTVRLQPEAWFTLLGPDTQQVVVPANGVAAAAFRMDVLDVGWHDLQVTGSDAALSDAVRRRVLVRPNGKEIAEARSDVLLPGRTGSFTVSYPAEAVPGGNELFVKIYPGLLSQAVEGLDALLKVPYG